MELDGRLGFSETGDELKFKKKNLNLKAKIED